MKKIISVLAVISILVSCKKKEVNTIVTDGISLNESILVDTFSITSSIILDDYKVTTENLLFHTVGSFNDKYYGLSSAAAYFKLEDENQFSSEEAVDSAFVEFKYSFFVQGDTTKVLSLELYETTEEFVDDSSYTHQSSLVLAGSPISVVDVTPMPNSDNVVAFKVSQAWIDAYKQKDIDNSFDNKALCIKAKDGIDASIISFSEATLNLVVYGKKDAVDFSRTTSLATSFDFDSYTFDRSGTTISSLLKRGDEVSSKDNGDRMLMQSGSGVSTKLELAGLKKFLKENPSVQIDKAELVVQVDENTTGRINAVAPDALMLYQAKDNVRSRNSSNELDGLILPDNTVFAGLSTSFYIYDESNLTYTIPFTAHLRSVVQDGVDLSDFILFAKYGVNDADLDGLFVPSVGDVYQITHSAVLYNENASDDKKPKLNIYYTIEK